MLHSDELFVKLQLFATLCFLKSNMAMHGINFLLTIHCLNPFYCAWQILSTVTQLIHRTTMQGMLQSLRFVDEQIEACL